LDNYNFENKVKELGDRGYFTILIVAVHSFTFIYNFLMNIIKRNNWYADRVLQYPRSEPDANLVYISWIKNIRNHFVIIPLLLYYLGYDAFIYMGMKIDYISWLQVSWKDVIRDLIISLIINDTIFYWGHRALHIPFLYKLIHKQHHQFKQPIAQASEWAHPVEDILANIIPTLAGCFIMGSHFYVLLFWIFLRIWKTLDAHCGYTLPFPLSVWHGLPGMFGCDMHDFHHESKEGMKSCFGAMSTFWDWICGTDIAFYEIKKKK
jgi:sterol desaturase/sphingolipid hydroxylase (fatty acid hydroxylase superfamily)